MKSTIEWHYIHSGNYIKYSVTNQNGKKKYVYIYTYIYTQMYTYTSESLCCIPETSTTF